MRHDVRLVNDAGVLSVLGAARLAAWLEEDDPHDPTPLTQAGELLLQSAEDGDLHVRLLVGELEGDERDWVARSAGVLHIPDGQLALMAGIDADDAREGPESGSVAIVDVAPGRYQVEILTYLSHTTGHEIARDWERPLGPWWRADHPDQPYPAWLAYYCSVESDHHDPEHADAWESLPDTARDGTLSIDETTAAYLGFVVRLSPVVGDGERTPVPEHLVFDPETGARRPPRCPRGVRSDTLSDDEILVELGLLDAPDDDDEHYPCDDPIDVVSRTDALPLTAIDPVALPIARLVDCYRMAWFLDDDTAAEIVVDFPRHTEPDPAWQQLSEVGVRVDGRRLRAGFEYTGGRWELMRWIRRCTPALRTVPGGAVVELALVADEGPGTMRFRGRLGANGTWLIDRIHPHVPRPDLLEALALLAATDTDGPLPCGTEDVANRARDNFRVEWSGLSDTPLERDGTTLIVGDPDYRDFVALEIFRVRFGPRYGFDSRPADPDALALAEARASDVPPAPGELVLDGKAGQYHRLANPDRPDDVVAHDADMAALGFRPIGDLLAEQFGLIAIYAYATDDGRAWGTYLRGSVDVTSIDIYTPFADGSSLTTTSQPGPAAMPHARARYIRLPDASPAELHAAHEAALDERGHTATVEPTLAAFARAIDDFVVRLLGGFAFDDDA